MKRKVKTMSIEDAIKEKFPDATIYEVRNDRFGKCILGVVPTKDGKIILSNGIKPGMLPNVR